MNRLPAPSDEEPSPKIVEAEIVEENGEGGPFVEEKRYDSAWGRFLSKAALSVLLGLIGLGMMGAGLILILTVIGLPFGLPLLGIGFFVCVLAVLVFFSRAQGTIVVGRTPRR
jgi:hypothetical protein